MGASDRRRALFLGILFMILGKISLLYINTLKQKFKKLKLFVQDIMCSKAKVLSYSAFYVAKISVSHKLMKTLNKYPLCISMHIFNEFNFLILYAIAHFNTPGKLSKFYLCAQNADF